MVRTAALVVALATYAIIADVSYHDAARVRAIAHIPRTTQQVTWLENWEFSNYLAAGLGASAIGWAMCWVPAGPGRFGRWGRPVSRLGTIGAWAGATAFSIGFGTWQWIDSKSGAFERDHFEQLWLMGGALGGTAGTAIGCGLGVVALAAGPRPSRSAIGQTPSGHADSSRSEGD